MRIALVSPYDWSIPGGVNSHVTQLAREYERAGHDATIIAPTSRHLRTLPENVHIICEGVIGLPASGSVANVCISYNLNSRVKEYLRNETFDVVHVHEPFMPLVPFQFMRYSKATNVATFHAAREGGSRLYAYGKYIIRPHWHNLHGRIAHSRSALRLIGKHFPDRYRIITSGVDCASYAEAQPLPEYLDGKRNILFLGRLEKRKGLPYLLQAYKRVKREQPETRLIIVGGDGGLRRGAERYARDNELDDVVFTGYVSDEEKARYFRTADVYCAPNTGSESLGIVLLEAMAAGTPVVGSRIEGFADVLTNGRQGLLVPPRDPEELASALSRLIADAGMREEMGKEAARTASQYSWDQQARKVLDFYEETIASRGNGHRPL